MPGRRRRENEAGHLVEIELHVADGGGEPGADACLGHVVRGEREKNCSVLLNSCGFPQVSSTFKEEITITRP